MDDADPIRYADRGRGWHLRPVRLRIARVILGLLGLTFALAGPLLWSSDDVAMSLTLTVMGVGFLLLACPRRRRRSEASTVLEGATAGMLIPVSRPSVLRALANLVVGGLAVVLGPAAAMEQHTWQPLGLVPLGALLCYLGYADLRLRRLPDRGVLLLPDAVVLQTRFDAKRIPWSEIRKVRAQWTRWVRGFHSPDEPLLNWLTFELRGEPLGELDPNGRPLAPSLEPTTLAVDPELALSVIRYYLEHPAHRDELGTERALERARPTQAGSRRS